MLRRQPLSHPGQVPWLGFVPDDVPSPPAAVVARLSDRLGIPVGELRGYGTRGQTRTDHLREGVHSWTAAPSTFSRPRNFRTNASSAGASVK